MYSHAYSCNPTGSDLSPGTGFSGEIRDTSFTVGLQVSSSNSITYLLVSIIK